MSQVVLRPVPFVPSAPLSGNEPYCIYRGYNMKLRGNPVMGLFYEAYAGSENLNQPIPSGPLTGTLAFSPSSLIVTGTGTAFLDELHLKQMILADGEPIVVAEYISQTQFRAARLPQSTETTASAERLPILFPLDINRASQWWGNALHFDKGTILSVGQGTLYVNGAVLPGDSLTATRRAQVALYDSATMTYDVQTIGFDDVPAVANTDVTVITSGGVKNMSLGNYSLRIAYYSTITGGFGNVTDTLLSGGLTGYPIAGANDRLEIDFSGDTPPAKADGYIIYGSAYGGSSAQSGINAIQGPWFEIVKVPFTDLVADTYTFDYVDTDLSSLVTFNNDSPPDAEFYGTLDRYPILVSTNGAGVNSTGRELSTSPGPFVSPIKADNFDAYPNTFKVPTEKGETIIGVLSAAGRMFVLTPNTLQAVTPTGLPSAPFTCRPFWKRGFQGTYNVAFIDDTLYGFTSAGAFRSIATGDEAAASNDFASNVEAQMASWHGGHVFVEQDLKNEEVCFIYSASRKNADGYWESDIFPYSLSQREWQPAVILTDPERDMIVSGVASINGHLEFIAGGRREGTTNRYDTWRYDTGSNVDVPYALAWNFQDNGVELTAKNIRMLRPKGKFTDAKIQLYLTTPDSNINVSNLETGTSPTFEYVLQDSTTVHQYEVKKCRARNGMMWTARVGGISNWDGVGLKDQFHELATTLDVGGQLR
jgi:hypothetical protein